jgi:BirA family biotin operon repressor/biotin-[acetyl-CoA-carboxylase] ligase
MNTSDFNLAIAWLEGSFTKTVFFETIGSTNDVVAEWARQGVRGMCLAAAGEQTQGRGRAGRIWQSPAGSCLAFSLLLDTASYINRESNVLGRVALSAALAICESLESQYGLKPQIKWPNDVVLNGKKVCGILPEIVWEGDLLRSLILGVGVNVTDRAIPKEDDLSLPAISIEETLGYSVDQSKLFFLIVAQIVKNTKIRADLIEQSEYRLAYKNEQVDLITDGKTQLATVLGLAGDGGVRALFADGEQRVFYTGEIQLRPHAK